MKRNLLIGLLLTASMLYQQVLLSVETDFATHVDPTIDIHREEESQAEEMQQDPIMAQEAGLRDRMHQEEEDEERAAMYSRHRRALARYYDRELDSLGYDESLKRREAEDQERRERRQLSKLASKLEEVAREPEERGYWQDEEEKKRRWLAEDMKATRRSMFQHDNYGRLAQMEREEQQRQALRDQERALPPSELRKRLFTEHRKNPQLDLNPRLMQQLMRERDDIRRAVEQERRSIRPYQVQATEGRKRTQEWERSIPTRSYEFYSLNHAYRVLGVSPDISDEKLNKYHYVLKTRTRGAKRGDEQRRLMIYDAAFNYIKKARGLN